MTISDSLLEKIIEGALMASGQPLSVERIQSLFDDAEVPDTQQVKLALQRLSERCTHRGFELKKVATGYRFQTTQNTVKWVSRLWEEKPQRYSRALLETLAIIAYRQPMTRGEIEGIRGVAVSSHITKTLLEREWVQVVGHRDVPGRPAMYATTKMFLDYFSMDSLEQLPTLEEIQEIADANHALELEDTVEEGNYDLSHQSNESDADATLESAAADLAQAQAIVQQVEENVFKKPDETDEVSTESSDVQASQVAQSLDQETLDQESEIAPDSEDGEDQSTGDLIGEQVIQQETKDSVVVDDKPTKDDSTTLSDNEQAEMIARMLADQEALLAEKALSSTDSALVKESDDASERIIEVGNEDHSDDFRDAKEEANIALLVAEQEELLAQQEEEINKAKEDENKALSDLAKKFTTELDN